MREGTLPQPTYYRGLMREAGACYRGGHLEAAVSIYGHAYRYAYAYETYGHFARRCAAIQRIIRHVQRPR